MLLLFFVLLRCAVLENQMDCTATDDETASGPSDGSRVYNRSSAPRLR